MLSLGINSLPAEGIMKTWKVLKDPWLRVQMMENPQLKLLLEIQLLIRANKPFALPINLSMNNIKKQHGWTLSPTEDEVFVIGVFMCRTLECTGAVWLEYRMSLITIRKTGSVTTLLSEMDFTVLSKLRDCSKTQRAAWNANVMLFYLI